MPNITIFCLISHVKSKTAFILIHDGLFVENELILKYLKDAILIARNVKRSFQMKTFLYIDTCRG